MDEEKLRILLTLVKKTPPNLSLTGGISLIVLNNSTAVPLVSYERGILWAEKSKE